MNVAIAGAGGIGSYLSQFLYDYGVNRNQFPYISWSWTIYDDDTVDQSNLLHQNFTGDDLGRSKALIIEDRTLGGIKAETRFMDENDFSKHDVIFSCVDDMVFRKKLYHYGWGHKDLYWIDGRCSSRNIGVYNSKVRRALLEPMLSDVTERKGCLLAVDKTNKVSHITPLIVAGIMVQEFLNHLRGVDTTEPVLFYL